MRRRWSDLPDLLSPEGRYELAESAALRARTRGAFARLRAGAWPGVQVAAAAAIALLAAKVLGHEDAFFAPVAAIVALRATRGQRVRQSLEMMLGVAIGIGVGDLLARAIGTGAWQLALFVGFALFAAFALGPGRMISTEAAVSAALVATIPSQTQGFPPTRFVDALLGGAVALLFSQVLFPVHPVRVVRDAIESVLGDLAATLDGVADALERRDLGAARETLVRSRRISDEWSDVERALGAGREAVRFAPPRRRLRAPFAAVEDVELPLDLIVRDARVLARGTVRALTIGDPVPDAVPAAIRDLAHGARELADEFAGGHDDAKVRDAALRAARRATSALSDREQLSTSILVGQVQAAAADMLRILGLEGESANEMIRDAAAAAYGDEPSNGTADAG